MIETKNERMNKGFLVLGCAAIAIIALTAMSVLNNESEKADISSSSASNIRGVEDTGRDIIAVQPETGLKTEPAKTEGSKTGVEAIKSNLKDISLPGKTLGPGETVQAFWIAVSEKRYDDAMKYISDKNTKVKSEWDLVALLKSPETTEIQVNVNDVNYLNEQKTMAEVYIVIRDTSGKYSDGSGNIYIEKEGTWKIVGW